MAGIHRILLGGIRVPVDDGEQSALDKARWKMKRAGFPVSSLLFRLYKRSIDARKKNEISLVCSVLAESPEDIDFSRLKEADLRGMEAKLLDDAVLCPERGSEPMAARPLVVGMGPAGLFCALLLAENGYAPILIDRGDGISERVQAVERFRRTGILDPESNIQFGAGGAGTFSDGKMLTRVNDPRCNYVLERFRAFGAPDDIVYQAKPHVGTDILRCVVDRLLTEIVSYGGEIRYRTCMTDIRQNPDGTMTVLTTGGPISCGAVMLAPGHSSRDTYEMLIRKQFEIIPKPISVGVRIEHLQEDIDRALYGNMAGNPALGHAEYALSDTRRERGVYTFCMCPGGEVVAAASEEGGLVVNGMSYHARNGKNANCAVAVSVRCEDYEPVMGNAALGAIAYQRAIERAAFRVGGGGYCAPIQTVGDFLDGTSGQEPHRVQPTYRDGKFVRVANLADVFPSEITEYLRYGIHVFGGKIQGFDSRDALLSAAETRTSAPVRILRGDGGCALGHPGIYPCGEGAGYAGGITSAAVDGIRSAERLMARYAPRVKLGI